MMRSVRFRAFAAIGLLALLAGPALFAQRTGYSPEEFIRHRAALMTEVKDGANILFGDATLSRDQEHRIAKVMRRIRNWTR